MRHRQQLVVTHSDITSKMSNARIPHPFNYDYAYLNELTRYYSQEAIIQADHNSTATQLKRDAENHKMYFIECWFRHLYHKSDATKRAEIKREWLDHYVLQQKKNYEFDRLESTSALSKVPTKEIAVAEREIVALENELKALETQKFLAAENESQHLESEIRTLSAELKNIDAEVDSLRNLINELVEKSKADDAIQEEIFDVSEALEELESQQSRINTKLDELTTQLEIQKTILNDFPLEKITTLRTELSRLEQEQRIRELNSKKVEEISRELAELDQLSLNQNGVFSNATVERKFDGSMKKTPTTWQAFAASTFEKRATEDKSADAFIIFVLESARSYLPERYMPYNEVTAAAELRFPASADARVPYNEFAHVLTHASGGKLIASHVPSITQHDTETNNTTTQNFLGMLHKMNVSMIIDLGTDADRSRRVAYHHVKNGQYTTSLTEVQSEYYNNGDSNIEADDDNFVSIAVRIEDNQSKKCSTLNSMHFKNTTSQENRKIGLCRIYVNDNTSLDLNNNTLQTMLAAHEKYKRGETVLVHCSSGVGRTGQVRLLFALLDAFSDDISFKTACLSIITIALSGDRNAASELLLDHSLGYFFNTMSKLLCNLRKTRYCVQTETQFDGTFSQFMLLTGKMIGLSDDQLNLLRARFSINEPASNSATANRATPRLPASQSTSSNPRPHFFRDIFSYTLATNARSAQEQMPNRPMNPCND